LANRSLAPKRSGRVHGRCIVLGASEGLKGRAEGSLAALRR
jgi:hypothetical protein